MITRRSLSLPSTRKARRTTPRAALPLVLVPSAAIALALPLSGGCLGAPPGVALHTTHLPLTGPCPEENTGSGEMASEVERLRVEISASGMQTVTAEGSVSTLVIEGVPAGEGRQVAVFGLSASGQPAWRGVRPNVTVVEGETSDVDVLLARIADLTCTRSTQSERRAFHTATLLDDGRVLLVGGARSETDASTTCGPGCTLLDATAAAEVYDPSTGTFSPAGTLQVPRMFHQATLLPNGRVAITGGTSEAFVDASEPFPIRPRTGAIAFIEVWDPNTNDFMAGLGANDPNGPRLFHAATTTADGHLLLTGGIPSSAGAGANDLGNAINITTLCDSDTMTCISGPTMNRRRAGHGAFVLEGGDVLIWGGSVDLTDGGFRPELLRRGSSSFELVDTAGFNDNRFNLFFAAMTQYQRYRVLAAGGLVRDSDGSFRLSSVQKAGSTRGAVYVFDGAQGGAGALSAGPYVKDANGVDVLDPLAIREPTFFGSAAPLVGGTRAVIAGGFRSLDLTPSDHLDLYGESPFAISPLTVGGQPRALREPRGGLVAVGVGDGTVLFSGGATADGAGARSPRLTAEVFADPNTPGGTP